MLSWPDLEDEDLGFADQTPAGISTEGCRDVTDGHGAICTVHLAVISVRHHGY